MSAKNWCFTLNNPTEQETAKLLSYEDDDVRTGAAITYIVFQYEEAPTTGTPHYQGYVQFAQRKRHTYLERVISPRMTHKVAKGNAAQNKVYCTKEESRLDGPWEFGTPTGGQGKRTDIAEFVNRAKQGRIERRELIETYGEILAKYPRFVSTVQRHYSEPIPTPFLPRDNWQFGLSVILAGQPDRRKVYWYWESIGNTGKSYYALNWNNGRSFGYVVTGGRHSDIFYAYGNEPVVFFDWARDSEDAFPYKVVENFKNGYFLNTKYESHACRFDIPHVVVFANFSPDESKLSRDRWVIKNISSYFFVPCTEVVGNIIPPLLSTSVFFFYGPCYTRSYRRRFTT